MAHFNTDSLDREMTGAEFAEFKARRRRGDFGPVPSRAVAFVVVIALMGFLAVFGWVFFSAWLDTRDVFARPEGGGVLSWTRFMPLLFLVVVVVGAVNSLRRRAASGRTRQSWAKTARFAEDNGLTFQMRSADPKYPGMLFQRGGARASTEHVWSDSGVLADAGGYTYSTGSGDDRKTYHWNFLAFRLPQRMPHMLLDARANNLAGSAGSNLPTTFRADQRLTLGAPFDEHFVLYAPADYAQDAFYIFPPDLMSLLLEVPPEFDIEIVDDWMFFYTQSPLDLHRSDTWRILERIENTLGARLSEMSNRYTDRRVSERPVTAPGVAAGAGPAGYGPGRAIAEQGQRLRPGVNWVGLGLFVLMALVMLVFFLLRSAQIMGR